MIESHRVAADFRGKSVSAWAAGSSSAHPATRSLNLTMRDARAAPRAGWFQATFQVSCVRSCRLAPFSRAAWYRKIRAQDLTALRLCIRKSAHARPRRGFLRIWILLRRDGWSG